jgi:hypothetical protein
MFHMLEHVPDPGRVLAVVRDWLAPGGHLVVEVPNVDSVVQAPRHRFHFAHLYSFNATTLAALGASVGLAAVSSRESGDGGNVTCVFGRADGLSGGPPAASGNAARTAAVLRNHTTVRHYLTPVPYRRAAQRLVRRLHEDRLLRRFPTVEALLDWAARWSDAPAHPSCR